MKIENFYYTYYDHVSEQAPRSNVPSTASSTPRMFRTVKVTGLEVTKNEHVNGVILTSVRISEKGKGSVWISAQEFYDGLDVKEHGDGPVRIVVCAKESLKLEGDF